MSLQRPQETKIKSPEPKGLVLKTLGPNRNTVQISRATNVFYPRE